MPSSQSNPPAPPSAFSLTSGEGAQESSKKLQSYSVQEMPDDAGTPLLMGARFFPRPFQQDVKSWFCIELLPFGGFGNIAFFAK